MAWIKMRTSLVTDGRVVSMARAVKAKPATVLGALFIFWAIADEQTENGTLPGHDAASIDRAVGVKGFAAALAAKSVGWLSIHPDGVTIPRFDDHNGASAKRRAEDAKRKGSVRKMSASERTQRGQNGELEERRGDKRREEPSEADGEERSPPTASESNPPPLSGAEGIIRRWVGDRLSASDRDLIARAERQRGEADFVVIHDIPQPATTLFERAIVEAIASSKDGGFRSAGPFLRLVGSIEARCARDGVWPGEGLERTNGHAKEPTTEELLEIAAARRAKR